ncbi:MAG TPA: recombinase family protein, partial [Hyphomicrobiaceae bacterium]|nr:recombinase family protein [Hyphomicrobiaceae bacterium]
MTRCAIYTRKSSDEGLDQQFNSLDAQREACEAYVLSQAGEGWAALPARYDDGGYSGGSMHRPALQQLLQDVATGRVDTIVVYKVDRLTRSLADFARIVDALDKAGASFVSVTQAFNTTSSMGRLTLNVLLSFAQFEREVTGERIRDKIAASKAKGMWMGGLPPLGYDPPDSSERILRVNDDEATVVRSIFERYLELRSVHALVPDLTDQGIVSKRRMRRDGRTTGCQPFSRGALFHLLRNRIYRGQIVHKGEVFEGRHDAIVPADLFDGVQAMLAEAGPKRRRTTASRAPLVGKLYLSDGSRLTPTHSRGASGRLYRYYAPLAGQIGQSRAPGPRLSAIRLEARLRTLLQPVVGNQGDPLEVIERVTIYA